MTHHETPSPSPGPATPAWARPLIESARRERTGIVLALSGAGASLVLFSIAGWVPERGASAFVGSFLLVYGALIALQSGWWGALGPVMRKRLQRAVVSSGFGFYGVMTLSRFLQLELHDLLQGLASFEATRSQLQGLIREALIGFSVQSLHNSIDAFMWPVKLMTGYGMAKAGVIVGAAWGLYALGARVFPEAHLALEAEGDEDEADEEATTEGERSDPPLQG